MTWQKPDINYWNNKFASYMHDPIDKVFDIQKHADRAADLLKLYGLQMPNNEFWKKSDGIASGFERGQITGHNKWDESKSGSVDFLKKPVITHPTGEECAIEIDFSENIDGQTICESLKSFIEKEIGLHPGTGGYSDSFKGDEYKFAIARFLYTHLVLRFSLSQNNIGNIGALWHRLPADTRFPDHSIWQHNALVSAIQSCFELAGNNNDIGIMVFSITPVQGYIAKARKLRDYWTGSVLLSWLAFEGIKWVIENLGPDHILYPSLIDQPLIDEYLYKNWRVNKEDAKFLNKEKTIASFPNKFLFLIPLNYANEISEEIENHIKSEWEKLNHLTIDLIKNQLREKLDEKDTENIKFMFKRQNSHFWDIQWAAVKMLEKKDRSKIENLLPKKEYEVRFDLLDIFLEMIKNKENYEKSGKGVLYPVSHSLCQSALAVQKTKKIVEREPEPGEKCQICGEFEVLHNKKYTEDMSAKDYEQSIKNFWKLLREKIDNNTGYEINENEKLCSICFTKRFAYRALKQENGHILYSAFEKSDSFPTTTYMALYNYFKRKKIEDLKKREIADKVFNADDINEGSHIDGIKIRDRYYAILLMDGDLMGKLVNGETTESSWKSIMHPDIVRKIEKNKLEGDYNKLWQKIFNEETRIKNRTLTPSIHAAISESLGDFALYGVAPIIKKYDGKLIYAGGDDVCAVLPIDNALSAADEIQKYYKSYFRLIKSNEKEGNDVDSIELDHNAKWTPEKGKLSVNLGKGPNITISAGILLCHHKENLSDMIKRAHDLLNKKAKEEGCRNAVAIEYKKRSGGSRYFVSKWDSDRLKTFQNLIDNKTVGEELSRSLAYRLEEFKDGIEAILKQKDSHDLLVKFILSQLKKSGIKIKSENNSDKNEKLLELSKKISKIVIDENGNFSNEGIIIAGFLCQ